MGMVPNAALALDILVPAAMVKVGDWDRAARFARLDSPGGELPAEWLACAAFEPGGVSLLGRHWCADNPCPLTAS